MASSTYKIRKLRKPDTKNGFDAASLAVPMEIARVLPEDTRFTAELVNEGILYRPVKVATPTSSDLPEWITSASEEETSEAKSEPAKTAAKSK